MSKKVVYILHKNGAKGHYIALDYLLKQRGIVLKHREFSVFSKLFKSITKLNYKLFKKQLVNITFFISLIFNKNKKIVLGIAPFDYKISLVLSFLKTHKVYYHTSWTCWDKTFYPKHKKKSGKVFKHWQDFLEKKAEHIFTVTKKSKQELLINYKIPETKISVVNHANSNEFYLNHQYKKVPNSFIYVGRLLPQKGILEILEYFKINKNARITIVGKGKEKEEILKYVQNHKNITYLNPIYDKLKLINVYKTHEYLILNSKRTKTWEELFGMIIIESMALGVIPIASNHSGPKEIISDKEGYIFNEGDLHKTLDKVITFGFSSKMSLNNVELTKQYSLQNISNRWKPILY